jgi:UDPglucose 6-dehydrogenase
LREGAAVKDTMNPDRIVVGIENQKAKKIMEKLYKPFARIGRPIMFTDIKSAEIIKYASNAFLGMKISFINQIANFCEKTGANVRDVAKGMGLDSRIGPRFLQAGIGYGGSCFKKDINALIQKGKDYGYDFTILNEVEKFNEAQKERLFHKLKERLPNLKGKKVAVWGVTFKPRTDDLRDAPSIPLVKKLIEDGAEVTAFDPIATNSFIYNHFREHRSIRGAKTGYDAVKDADALMLLTEWDEFRGVDFKKIKKLMKGNLVLDGRNIYDPDVIRDAGFEYIGIGVV